MSRENVELVRRGYEAWNAGDMAAVAEGCHPDVVWHHVEGWPEPGPSVGREAVIRAMQQMREAFDTQKFEPLAQFIDAGDRVLVKAVWRGIGQGPEVEMQFTHVFTVRDGKLIEGQTFFDHAEALRAVGLSE
jgi:uncharacterized protein